MENPTKERVENAIRTGDVDRLVDLYKQSIRLKRDHLIDLINDSVNEIASYHGLELDRKMSFKEFVLHVYDPYQAQQAIKKGTRMLVSNLSQKGISFAINVIPFLHELNDPFDIGKVLYYILLKIGHQYVLDLQKFVEEAEDQLMYIIKGLNDECVHFNEYWPLEQFFRYPGVVKAYSYGFDRRIKIPFFRYYLEEHPDSDPVQLARNLLALVNKQNDVAYVLNLLSSTIPLTYENKRKIVDLLNYSNCNVDLLISNLKDEEFIRLIQ